MTKREILAVHKKNLEDFLKKIEVWEPFTKGEMKCVMCGTTLSFDNIGLIIPSGDKITMCCSNVECMFRIKELQGEKASEG